MATRMHFFLHAAAVVALAPAGVFAVQPEHDLDSSSANRVREPMEDYKRWVADFKKKMEQGEKYNKLALKTHPDKNQDDPRATEKFKALLQAKKELEGPTEAEAAQATEAAPAYASLSKIMNRLKQGLETVKDSKDLKLKVSVKEPDLKSVRMPSILGRVQSKSSSSTRLRNS